MAALRLGLVSAWLSRGAVGAAWVLGAAFALGLAPGRASAQTGAPSPSGSGVYVMVFPASMFRGWPGREGIEDHATFTYGSAIGQNQALADTQAYSKITSRTLHAVQITTETTPLTGIKLPPTTCVTFTSQGMIPETGGFELEPLICSLKGYKKLRFSFIADPSFRFTGLRSYDDRYVSIRMDSLAARSSTTYTYDVAVKDPSFGRLNLPTWQADPAVLKRADETAAHRRTGLLKTLGVVAVCGAAALAGYFVYTFMLVKAPSA